MEVIAIAKETQTHVRVSIEASTHMQHNYGSSTNVFLCAGLRLYRCRQASWFFLNIDVIQHNASTI